MLFLLCVLLQNPALPALNCSVENAHPTVSYYARPQVASYNTYYHSPPHLPPYSAYDFQVCSEGNTTLRDSCCHSCCLVLSLIMEPPSYGQGSQALSLTAFSNLWVPVTSLKTIARQDGRDGEGGKDTGNRDGRKGREGARIEVSQIALTSTQEGTYALVRQYGPLSNCGFSHSSATERGLDLLFSTKDSGHTRD